MLPRKRLRPKLVPFVGATSASCTVAVARLGVNKPPTPKRTTGSRSEQTTWATSANGEASQVSEVDVARAAPGPPFEATSYENGRNDVYEIVDTR